LHHGVQIPFLVAPNRLCAAEFRIVTLNGVILPKRPYINMAQPGTRSGDRQTTGRENMWRLIKTLFILVLLAAVAFVAYAYAGPLFFPNDFAPPSTQITQPVTLETK
jgi:hypothetical protein